MSGPDAVELPTGTYGCELKAGLVRVAVCASLVPFRYVSAGGTGFSQGWIVEREARKGSMYVNIMMGHRSYRG